MSKLSRIAFCVTLSMAFSCQADWYNQNPDAWLKAIENTERARLRAEKREEIKPKLPPIELPVAGVITSKFGMRVHPLHDELKHHSGIDIAAKRGAPITAVNDGVVVRATYSPSFGNVIEIDHGNGKITRYAHADTMSVKVGDLVSKGGQIATVGSTGLATGPHIHFEVIENGRRVNPLKGSSFELFQKTARMLAVVSEKGAKVKVEPSKQPVEVVVAGQSKPEISKLVEPIQAQYEIVAAIKPVQLPVETSIDVMEQSLKVAPVDEVRAVVESEVATPETENGLKSIKLANSVAIWDLAKEIRGESSIYQAILAIYNLNPGIFIRDNINLRKAGVHVVLPSHDYIASMSRKEGLAKVNADNLSLKQRNVSTATA